MGQPWLSHFDSDELHLTLQALTTEAGVRRAFSFMTCFLCGNAATLFARFSTCESPELP